MEAQLRHNIRLICQRCVEVEVLIYQGQEPRGVTLTLDQGMVFHQLKKHEYQFAHYRVQDGCQAIHSQELAQIASECIR